MKLLMQITLAISTALVLSGCGEGENYAPQEGTNGADMFAAACSGCHNDSGKGYLGFLLKIAGTDMTEEEVTKKIAKGGLIMPEFVKLSQQQKLDIANYLKQ